MFIFLALYCSVFRYSMMAFTSAGETWERRHSGLDALHDLGVGTFDRFADVGFVGDDGRAVRQLALAAVEALERPADRLAAVERMAGGAALVLEDFASAREHGRRRRNDRRDLVRDVNPRGHVVVLDAAVFVADDEVVAGFVERDARVVHRAWDCHQVHIRADDLHPVRDVGGAQIDIHRRAGTDRDLSGLESPHARDVVNLVSLRRLSNALINHLPLEERAHVGQTGRKPDAELFHGQRDDAGERENENGGGGEDALLDHRLATMTAARSVHTAT
jgi:hypothetical protein